MGLNDTAEMLEACKADAAQLERDLTRTRAERDVQIVESKRLQRALDELRRLCDESEEQTAEMRRASQAENGYPSHMQALLFVEQVRAIVGQAADLDEEP